MLRADGLVLGGVPVELWLAWRGDAAAVADDAHAMLAPVEREALDAGSAQHCVLLHWAEGVAGDTAAALPRLRHALAEVRAGGHIAERAAFLELEANLALRAGRTGDAAAAIDAAFAHVETTGQRCLLARLWQRRAEIARVRGDAAAAAQARAQATRGATAQGATPGA